MKSNISNNSFIKTIYDNIPNGPYFALDLVYKSLDNNKPEFLLRFLTYNLGDCSIQQENEQVINYITTTNMAQYLCFRLVGNTFAIYFNNINPKILLEYI